MNRILLSLLAASLASPAVLAQFQLITPNNSYANVEGNSNFTGPWNYGTAGGRHQDCHDSTQFTSQGVNTPIWITRLRYRTDFIQNSWTGGTYTGVVITMSTCPVNHLSLSNTFANNHGLDQTTVLNGNVVVSPGQGGNSPSAWYVDIALTTPFLYDPTSGNDLLIDTTVPATSFTGQGGIVDHVTGATTALGSRVWIAGTPTSPTGNASFSPAFNYTPVLEFTYLPATGLWSNFTADVTTGPSPLFVTFTDRSISNAGGGITSWQWDLNGDTVIDSTVQNPTFNYPCGSFNVSLTVTDASGVQTTTKNGYIITDKTTANFTWTPQPNLIINFTDTSTGVPTTWAWDFTGDNVTDSTQQNPIWAYGNGCHHPVVSLTVQRGCGPAHTLRKSLALAPNSITTRLTSSIGTFGGGSGHLFDITVHNPNGINICAMTALPYGDGTQVYGTPVSCTFWVTDAPGGYNTNHNNAAVWRQAATATGLYLGGNTGSPRPVDMGFDRPVYLAQGTYGIAIYTATTGTVGFSYGGTLAPVVNTDLTINAGVSKFGLFSATINTGRPWSGTLHYGTQQSSAGAGYGFFGAGCPGSLGIAGQSFTGLPSLGGTMNVTVNRLPQSAMLYIAGVFRTTSTFGPLPFDASPFGMPGCFLRASNDSVMFSLGSGNTAPITFNVPNNNILNGMSLFTQPLSIDPGFNALGATLGDAWATMVSF